MNFHLLCAGMIFVVAILTPNDDVTITRNFYNIDQYSVDTGNIKTYTLTPQSRRYAVAIPNADIIAGNGDIEQNKY